MILAQEYIIVAEHQQQVGSPQQHHQFHECDDTRVARHGAGGDVVLLTTEEQPLPPVDEVASVLCTEQVHYHNHHPKTERGGQYEIFGTGYDFTRHRVEFRLRAETVGKIHEEKFHPACPEEQTAEESPECLARISFGEYADNHHRHTYRAHDKGRIVQNGLAHQMLHDNHQPVPQRHGKQYHEERSDGFPPIAPFGGRRCYICCFSGRYVSLFHIPLIYV